KAAWSAINPGMGPRDKPEGDGIGWLSRQMGEGAGHGFIGRALERHDQVAGLVQPAPAPGLELDLAAGRRMDGQVDLCLRAVQAPGEPFLLLAAPAPALPRRD